MRLIILDYGGTLTRLPDKADFVRKLIVQGDWPCLYTGNDITILRKIEPDLMVAIRQAFQKGTDKFQDLPSLVRAPTPITEVVVVDDESLWEFPTRCMDDDKIGGWPWRFVYAGDIETLLNNTPESK
jgi:hypothetical protein